MVGRNFISFQYCPKQTLTCAAVQSCAGGEAVLSPCTAELLLTELWEFTTVSLGRCNTDWKR